MDLFKKCEQFDMHKKVIEKGIYPYFHYLESKQDAEVTMEGKNEIMLGSNNYLGLTCNEEVMEAGIKAIEKYGTGCSGSRFLNGTLDLHLELERELAAFLNKEACITFGTGFQSNLGIISAIAGRCDYIVGDRENHASIYDACRLSYAKLLRYKHSDMEDLERLLKTVPETAGILIVTDGVFSMGGDVCNLPEILRLAKKYGARVMLDEAHGLGVMGKTGRGTGEYFDLLNEVDIYMGTFSKSLASIGGYCAASQEVIDYIMHTSRPFIFSASMTPANTACALAALRVLKRQPELSAKLMQNAEYMRKGFKERKIDIRDSVAPIIPINTYNNERTFVICHELFENGVYVNPVISPAVPEGECIIRTSYTAAHNFEQLERALNIIGKVFADIDK